MENGRPLLAGLALLAVAGCGSTVQMTSQAQGAQQGLTTGTTQDQLAGAPAGGTAATAPGGLTPGATSSLAPGAAQGTSGPLPTDGPLPASGSGSLPRGMTAKTIKIGIFTVAGFSTFGSSLGISVSTGDQAAEAKAVITYLNAHGGIAGRQIIPVFHDESVAGAASNYEAEMQATCSSWTQDDHVYAVASPVGTNGSSLYDCLAHAGVITSSAGESRDAQFFTQYANTFYMPVEMNLTRIMRDNVDALSAGSFWGANPKIGVIRLDSPEEKRAVSQGLLPGLAAHGLKLADTFALAADGGTTQYQSAVLRFQAEGITHVLFTYASPLLFMEDAESQHYHPHYGIHSRSSPAALLQGNVPSDQLAGTMGMGWQQYNDVDAAHDPGPPSARAKLCLQLMQQAGQNTKSGATALIGLWYCDALFFLRDALAGAPSYSLSGFRTGAEKLSRYEAASTFRSTFGPGRLHDGASAYRLFAFHTACSCFEYVSPVKPAA